MSYLVTAEDLRAEGLPDDGRALELADLVEAFIERDSGFSFRKQTLTFTLDGTGTNTLTLPQPILSLTSVTLDGTALVEGTDYYARKSRPPGSDDRRWPRLILYDTSALVSGTWGTKRQSAVVVGSFGYTRAVGAAEVAPAEIKRAALRLVALELARIGADDEQTVRKVRAYATSFSAGGADVSLSVLAVSGGPTHVPEIDTVLDAFRHPLYAARPVFAFGGV